MKSSLLKSLSLVALLATTTPVFADDPVVAVVDGKKFTYSEVLAAKSSLPKQFQSESDEKLFPVLVNQAVDNYLINKAAEAAGTANQADVKKAIEKAKEGIISQAYLLEKIKPLITDKAVEEKYAEVVKNFPKEKEVHLRHILVPDESTAKAIIKALKNGQDFQKLAQSKSTDETSKDGGDLGFFLKSQLPKELADAAFDLSAGAYSQTPIKTDFGWHVIKVEGFRDAKPPKMEEVKNELKALVTQEAILDILKKLRSQAKVELFNKDGTPLKEGDKKAADKSSEKKDKTDEKKS